MRIGPGHVLAILLAPLAGWGCSCLAQGSPSSGSPTRSELAGVYQAGPLEVLEVGEVDGYLSVVPPFWGSKPYFARAEDDVFRMALPFPSPGRTVSFLRDRTGAVEGLVLAGVDHGYDGKRFIRTGADAATPGQLFLTRRPEAAAKAALADTALTADDLYDFASRHLQSHPSRAADTAAFLRTVASAHPREARLAALHGRSLVAAGRRDEARQALVGAFRLDPASPLATETARRLSQREPVPGRGYRAVLPFALEAAFAPPSPPEIDAVRRAWSGRDLSARDVAVVHRFELALEHATFDGAILRHTVGGSERFGAVLIPKGRSPGTRRSLARRALPVVIDARGVNFFYSPLDLSRGDELTTALGEAQGRFLYVIPAMRGHAIVVNGDTFRSGGDASDAWDGATDDTLAFLNAALATFPEADAGRIAIVGKSRGGTVALLAGERDPRIGLVECVVGPVDRFTAMNPVSGFTWAEVLADDMRDGRPPSIEEQEESSQVFDHFLDRALNDGEDLDAVRRRMLASSPLYFIESLPRTDAYYGAEDTSVPVANALRLREAGEALGRAGPDLTVQVFAGRGHDTDPYLLHRSMRRRLTEWAARPAEPVPRRQDP